jgi:hypothetical protein
VQRRGAFENAGLGEPMSTLVSKVAEQPTNVTDEDFAAARASGLVPISMATYCRESPRTRCADRLPGLLGTAN